METYGLVPNGSFESGTVGLIPDKWAMITHNWNELGVDNTTYINEMQQTDQKYFEGEKSLWVHSRVVDTDGLIMARVTSTSAETEDWINAPRATHVRVYLRDIKSTHSNLHWGWSNNVFLQINNVSVAKTLFEGKYYTWIFTSGETLNYNHYNYTVVGADEENWYVYEYTIPESVDKTRMKIQILCDACDWTFYDIGYFSDLEFVVDKVELLIPPPVHNIDTGVDYPTIQEAIDAPETLDGHTLRVDAGTYYEHVTMHKSVSLVGEDISKPYVTIIDGNSTGNVIEVLTDEVNIAGFTIQNSGPSTNSGIYLGEWSTNTNISYNSIKNNAYGIRLFNSTNNVVADNYVSDNTYGVILENSGNNTLIRNDIYGNEYDFGVYGKTLPEFCQDIDTSNRVSAGGIYYLVNQNDFTVDPLAWPYRPMFVPVGYFAAINSTNITLSSVLLECNVQGVLLAYTGNSLVEHVETTNNFAGIWLHHSVNNSIIGNTISSNIEGIHMTDSSNNAIFHNSFVGNADQVKINELDNTWDDGYPSGGNHWSDHTGVDEKSGPNQDQPGSDDIIDTLCVIDENNQDNYPLKQPWFNIAISNILTSKTTTNDTIVYIAALIRIPPDFREPLEINVYSNSTLIATKTTEPADYFLLFMIFPIRLNTTLMLKGSYLMSANVSSVSNETYTVDNTYVGGTFEEVLLGNINHDGIVNILDISTVAMAYPSWTIREDVNHDGIVNLIDVVIVASAFNSEPGHPRWNPDADINEDGKVDIMDPADLATRFGWMATNDWNQNVDWNNDLVINILDLAAAAINFGKTDP